MRSLWDHYGYSLTEALTSILPLTGEVLTGWHWPTCYRRQHFMLLHVFASPSRAISHLKTSLMSRQWRLYRHLSGTRPCKFMSRPIKADMKKIEIEWGRMRQKKKKKWKNENGSAGDERLMKFISLLRERHWQCAMSANGLIQQRGWGSIYFSFSFLRNESFFLLRSRSTFSPEKRSVIPSVRALLQISRASFMPVPVSDAGPVAVRRIISQ